MKLTGKCEQEFEKWYCEVYKPSSKLTDINWYYFYVKDNFEVMTPSEKWGVYVDFFDNVGIIIELDCGNLRHSDEERVYFQSGIRGHKFSDVKDTRPEARTAAVEKADEIFNNR